MVDAYAIVRRITGHELISPNDSRRLIEAVDGLMDEIAGKDARIAELAAENERLNAGWDHTSKMLGAANARAYEAEKAMTEALASTGAVKVKALEWTKLSTGWISHTPFHAYEVVATDHGFMATYANRDFAWGEEETMKHAAQADYERRILSALTTEPAAPEGQQEVASPSDRESRACVDGSESAIQPQQEQAVTEAAPTLHQICCKDNTGDRVTEAMIEAAYEKVRKMPASVDTAVGDLDTIVRAALKAAMDAGHD